MSATFDLELVTRVIGHLKESADPLDALDGLTADQIAVIKATWAIGSNFCHVGQWDAAIKYKIPVKGALNDKEYIAGHDLLNRLRVGMGKICDS